MMDIFGQICKQTGSATESVQYFAYRGCSLFTSLLVLQYLKVHKTEIFFGFDFEICIISLLVM